MLVVYHRDGLEVVALDAARPLVVGRTEPSDIRPRSRRLSRRHAQFGLADGEVWVEDLGSSNGTFVEGARVTARTSVPRGAEITLGSVTIVVHHPDERWLHAIGLPGHPRFEVAFASEIERAETFGRTFALLMFRSRDPVGPSLPTWIPRLAERLRPVDRLAIFGPDSVQVLMPESSAAEAGTVARQLVTAMAEEVPLACGIAAFPDAGRTAAELTEAVRTSVLRATPAEPIEVHTDPEPAAEGAPADGPVVRDAAMVALYRTVERVAPSMISVLVVGETGTGKEVLARALHERSQRGGGPLRVVNCGAIPPTLLESTLFGHEKGAFTGADRRRVGVFEEASGGTVFLDEVGELPLLAQVALLRVLESRRIQRIGSSQEIEVDVRVVAATHRNLEAMCDDRTFRWDLLYRLNGITLRLPPLRERQSEIRPLVGRFVRESNRINGRAVRAISPDAMLLLERYPWPGNVRELRNTVDRAVVVATTDVLTVEDLPERLARGVDLSRLHTEISGPDHRASLIGVPLTATPVPAGGLGDLKDQVRAYEIDLIRSALREASGNQTQASELLAIPRRTLVYKLRAYGIQDWELSPPLEIERDHAGRPLEFSLRVERFERSLIEDALSRTGGNPRAAARLLNIQPRTLEQKLTRRV